MPETATDNYDRERRELDAWFARYDRLAAANDIQATASMALFPLNVVTDGPSPGSGRADQWTRTQYEATMSQVMGGDDVQFTSERTPHFLSRSLAVVFTRSTVTVDGEATEMHYADILVKQDGEWYFQTMIQGGWDAAPAGTG